MINFVQTIYMNRPLLSLFFFLLSLSTSTVTSQVSPALKITATPPVISTYFGNSVAIDGPFAVVGRPSFFSSNDGGSAFVFERNAGGTWDQVQILTPSDLQPGDHFGTFTAISGNFMAISSWDADLVGPDSTLTDAGAVYMFEKNPGGLWQEVAKITAPDARSKDFFARVALHGRFLVVGSATSLDEHGMNFVKMAGAAYVFERTDGGSWLPVQKLTASDRQAPEAHFSTVAINGNTIAVGATGVGTDAAGNNAISQAGAVYVFKRVPAGTWSEVQKITPSLRYIGGQFGVALDVSGNTLLVGTRWDNTDETGTMHISGAGSAYLFESNSAGVWSQVKKLVAHDRHDNDYFGRAVSLSGQYALVGAYEGKTDENGGNFMLAPGSVYLYEKAGTTWSLKKKLVAPDRSQNDNFGTSVSISGAQMIIGAPFDDDNPNDWVSKAEGSAYIFTIENPLAAAENELLSVSIYPNPTSGNLVITGFESAEDLVIILRDVSGKLLHKTTASQSGTVSYRIDQPQGLYFLEISSGTSSVVKKVSVH